MTTGREAGTLSSPRALLDVAAVVRSHDDLRRLLEAMAATIAQELGFGAVVVNVYRPAPSAEARAELLRGAGTQFDERVVEAFLRVLDAV